MAKEYIERELFCNEFCRCASDYCTKEICPIWKTPTADVAPVVHGRWKVGKRTSYGRTLFLCTACKEAGDIPTCMGDPIYKHCPNCGAKMDLEEGDTDV